MQPSVRSADNRRVEDPVRAFKALPRRIYLDTGVLQTIFDYGGTIWEAEPLQLSRHAARVQELPDDVAALRYILMVNERAQFQFVVTAASLREVDGQGDGGYSQWVRDVEDTWLIQSEGLVPAALATLNEARFGMISVKDRRLLQDALDTGCDAFMTVEKRLPRVAPFIERTTGLRVMRPPDYWQLLEPWARLHY